MYAWHCSRAYVTSRPRPFANSNRVRPLISRRNDAFEKNRVTVRAIPILIYTGAYFDIACSRILNYRVEILLSTRAQSNGPTRLGGTERRKESKDYNCRKNVLRPRPELSPHRFRPFDKFSAVHTRSQIDSGIGREGASSVSGTARYRRRYRSANTFPRCSVWMRSPPLVEGGNVHSRRIVYRDIIKGRESVPPHLPIDRAHCGAPTSVARCRPHGS